MIPKKIHYCWFGKSEKSELALKCIESWKKYCPDYEIIEWNEDNFDINSNQYVKEAYEAKKWAFVSDYARLKIIYDNGGLYFDVDVELIKNPDELLENSAFMGFESKVYINSGLGFGAEKHHDGIKKMLDLYDNLNFINSDGTYNMTTCTVLTTDFLKKYGFKSNDEKQSILNITMYPSDYFCPKDYETGMINITKNTYSIHHFNMSWFNKEEKKSYYFTIKMKKFFGKKIGGFLAKYILLIIHPIKTIKKIFKLV